MDKAQAATFAGWLDDLGRDLRRTLRGLKRSPGFTAAVTLILALGIGAGTAMFSIVNGILLRPLPYPDPGAIVRIGESSSLLEGVSDMMLSNRSMPLLQENAESFEQLAAYQGLRAANGTGSPCAAPGFHRRCSRCSECRRIWPALPGGRSADRRARASCC